eukprot:3413396-Lingulodinium_polyedra.AAC.1
MAEPAFQGPACRTAQAKELPRCRPELPEALWSHRGAVPLSVQAAAENADVRRTDLLPAQEQ